MSKRWITTDSAPQAVGPYSQAVVDAGLVFCSGQIPLDPAAGTLVTGNVGEQTRQVLENLKAVLTAAGSSLDEVCKATLFLTDLADFSEVNDVYESYFGKQRPARSTIQVAALPLGARIEIEVIATIADAR